MAGNSRATAARVAAALRRLPDVERQVFLAILTDDASYGTLAERLGIRTAEAERAFAAALVTVADALEAPPPTTGVRRALRKLVAAARLARHRSWR